MVEILKYGKPKIAILDMDFPIYYSSAAAEQTYYVYYDEEGNEVKRFKTAEEGKAWVEGYETFGFDLFGDFQGDIRSLSREVEWEAKSIKLAKECLENMRQDWVERTLCQEWQGKCAAAKGMQVFRHAIARQQPYKGNRKGTRKPHHLEGLRKWALNHYPQLTKTIGGLESDDVVVGKAVALGSDGCIAQEDKDSLSSVGCWILVPSYMDEPIFSPPDSVGEVWLSDKGKMKGYGWLHLLAQCLLGDRADHIKGCPGVGEKGSVSLLEPYNKAHISRLDEPVKVVLESYRDVYGDDYEFPHWETGEMIKDNFKGMFIENLTLLYMVKHKNDKPYEILKTVEEFK